MIEGQNCHTGLLVICIRDYNFIISATSVFSFQFIEIQAIHKKILSLNFRDCHAKIRQVDSQGTLDGAVVVQVRNIFFISKYLLVKKSSVEIMTIFSRWLWNWSLKNQ